jgi:ATP-dependent DNA helicase RecG
MENGNPTPEWSEQAGSVYVAFNPAVLPVGKHTQSLAQVVDETGTKLAPSRNQVLKPLLDAAFIEMTLPEKPRSSKQRYRLTPKGKAWMKKHQKDNG